MPKIIIYIFQHLNKYIMRFIG